MRRLLRKSSTGRLSRYCGALAALVLGGSTVTSEALAQQTDTRATVSQSSRVDSVEMDVLMRGPVHEGFAEPAASTHVEAQANTRGSLQLPDPIPEPIDERPAQARPVDDRREAIWLPGYWGVEDHDHLCWVSGAWRFSPPGMQWVPGYWHESGSGYDWVPGFWVDESMEQIDYLPAPPAPPEDFVQYREVRDGQFWVPGKYVWRGDRYVWTDGFWARSQSDWVWIPQRLVRTPRGYVQVNGYWDYPIDRRGTLFAPVRFANRNYRQTYRPNVAVNVAQALVSWFVRPNYGHYYFGSYYGDRYRDFGIVPWAAYTQRANYYDPLYAYYATTRYDYLQDLVNTRQRLVTGGDLDLPVTYRQYQQFQAQGTQGAAFGNLARSIDDLVSDGKVEGFENLQALTATQGDNTITRIEEQAQALRRFAEGRREAEVRAEGEARAEADARGEAGAEADAEAGVDVDTGDQRNMRERREQRQETREERRDQRQDAREGDDRAEDGAANEAENAEDRADGLRDRLEERRDSVRDRIEQARERAGERGEEARERAEELRERAGQTREEMRERGREAIDNARERTGEEASQLQDRLRDRAEQLRQRGGDATERAQQQLDQGAERGRRSFDMRPFRSEQLQQRAQQRVQQRAEQGADAANRTIDRYSPPEVLNSSGNQGSLREAVPGAGQPQGRNAIPSGAQGRNAIPSGAQGRNAVPSGSVQGAAGAKANGGANIGAGNAGGAANAAAGGAVEAAAEAVTGGKGKDK